MEKMIEKFFKSSSPIVIKDCFIMVNNKPLQIKKSYLFIKTHTLKVSKIGDIWVVDNIKDKVTIKGYFYSEQILFGLFNEELEGANINLIGNVGNSQYEIDGVSIGNSQNIVGKEEINIYKFSALDYKITIFPKEKKDK